MLPWLASPRDAARPRGIPPFRFFIAGLTPARRAGFQCLALPFPGPADIVPLHTPRTCAQSNRRRMRGKRGSRARPSNARQMRKPQTAAVPPARTDAMPAEATLAPQRSLTFPVAGIGASAGGVDALRRFFRALPGECGIGFVIVQHLDPTHKSNMAELLRQDTQMPVVEARNNTPVEVDRVYVIPPNAYLAIQHG